MIKESTINFVLTLPLRNCQRVKNVFVFYAYPPMAYLSFSFNILVFILCIIIYLRTKSKSHKPAFLFIGSLAFVDSIHGFCSVLSSKIISAREQFPNVMMLQNITPEVTSTIVEPEFSFQSSKEDSLVHSYLLKGWPASVFLSVVSLNLLLVLTIDRYIFIKKPLHYPIIMTMWKIFLMIFSALIIAAILAIITWRTLEVMKKNIFVQH